MRFWIICTVLVLFLGLTQAYAGGKGKGPPNPPAGKGPPPDPRIPIDGGIGFLLAAGIALGSRKLYKSFKDKS